MILSRSTKRNYLLSIQNAKLELEKLYTEHSMISKYHQKRWFQKIRFQSEAELLERFFYLARLIDTIEIMNKELQDALDMDYFTRNCIEDELLPFKNINLSEIELVQRELF